MTKFIIGLILGLCVAGVPAMGQYLDPYEGEVEDSLRYQNSLLEQQNRIAQERNEMIRNPLLRMDPC